MKKKQIKEPSIRTLKSQLKKANKEIDAVKKCYATLEEGYVKASDNVRVFDKALTDMHRLLSEYVGKHNDSRSLIQDLEAAIRVLSGNPSFGDKQVMIDMIPSIAEVKQKAAK